MKGLRGGRPQVARGMAACEVDRFAVWQAVAGLQAVHRSCMPHDAWTLRVARQGGPCTRGFKHLRTHEAWLGPDLLGWWMQDAPAGASRGMGLVCRAHDGHCRPHIAQEQLSNACFDPKLLYPSQS